MLLVLLLAIICSFACEVVSVFLFFVCAVLMLLVVAFRLFVFDVFAFVLMVC